MRHILNFKFFEKSKLLNIQDNVDIELINKIKSLIPIGKILEISCGNAADAIELSKLGYDVTATDLNIDYVNNASKFVNSIQHNTLDRFEFNNNSFDLVYSRLGLHYFTELQLKNIFKEIARISKLYLVISVKLVDDIQTGKIILNEETWKELVSNQFEIITSTVRTGTLYQNESKWLEIVAKKKSTGDSITCGNCYWKWNTEEDDDNKYLCHKCGYDNELKEFDMRSLDRWKKENRK